MSCARNLYPDTAVFVTCQCVHQSYRMVPTAVVRRVIDFCFGVVSTRHRTEHGMEFYEYEFLSTHYHLVANNSSGKITDFLQDLNALIARELNAIRGANGAFFAREPGIQTILGEGKLFDHCVYTLANAVAAGIVHKTAHWKGSNSLRREYGKQYVVSRPRLGLWAKKAAHAVRGSSRRSGRAAFAGRSKLPTSAVIMLDRPPIMLELTDAQLRTKIRQALAEEEARIAKERGQKPVLGMKAALQIHWSTVPKKGQQLFGRNPTFSTETPTQRAAMRRLRREFLRDYEHALARWNAGDRTVIFPAGTVRMRLRHNVPTAPPPAWLLSS